MKVNDYSQERFISLTLGDDHSCGLTASGGAYCWGADELGQLGDGSPRMDKNTPVPVYTQLLGTGRFIKLSAGSAHTCGISDSGLAFCWGSNSDGQIGDDSAGVDRLYPVAVKMDNFAGERFIDISAGGKHSCGVLATGRALCWGDNGFDQLGDDDYRRDQPTPVAVKLDELPPEDNLVGISAGSNHSCALSAAGRIYCWGYDNEGQLGDNPVNSRQSRPVLVDMRMLAAGDTFKQVHSGAYYTCGLTVQGEAFCWGADNTGMLGDNDILMGKPTPAAVDVPMIPPRFAHAEVRPLEPSRIRVTLSRDMAEGPWGIGTGFMVTGVSGIVVDSVQRDRQRNILVLNLGKSVGPEDTLLLSYNHGLVNSIHGLPLENFSPMPVLNRLPGQLRQLAIGRYHGCGLTAMGHALCWGDNQQGQTGSGRLGGMEWAPVAVGRDALLVDEYFLSLAAGGQHNCGLSSLGKAYCWGANASGQLGLGTSVDRSLLPAAVAAGALSPGERFTELSAGGLHTCGRTSYGRVYCWGDNYRGQLGDGQRPNDQNTPSAVEMGARSTGERFVKVTAGNEHTCGLSGKGDAYCWGYDEHGQLGNGAGVNGADTPVLVLQGDRQPGEHFIFLRAGSNHTCGLSDRGKAYCWGYDNDGQLGNGATVTEDQHEPSAVEVSALSPGERFLSLTGGDKHTCGVTSSGRAFCWGKNSSAELGSGQASTVDEDAPRPVDMSALGDDLFISLNAGEHFTCGLTVRGHAYCWGGGGAGQLGVGVWDAVFRGPVMMDLSQMPGDRFVNLAAAPDHTCGHTSSGMAFCWGRDNASQLGDGVHPNDNRAVPVAVAMGTRGEERFVGLATGLCHSCALTASGEGYCWGRGSSGQLGDGTDWNTQIKPTKVDRAPLAGDRFKRIVVGNDFSCGLSAAGLAFCWGSDTQGKLGNGASTANELVPSAVDASNLGGEGFVTLVAGSHHACGLTASGTAYCWGRDDYGQCGDGDGLTSHASPVAVDTAGLAEGDTFILLTAGAYHSCGLTAHGRAYCWGEDYNGQLGNDGTKVRKWSPVEVDLNALPVGDRFIDLEAGASHSGGITGQGKAYCWGDNFTGQCGTGLFGNTYPTPSAMELSALQDARFRHLSFGGSHSCALSASGVAYCWGDDDFGQLGNGPTLEDRHTPTEVQVDGLW